jgi:tetratricopeptide (TPR) repeat protein
MALATRGIFVSSGRGGHVVSQTSRFALIAGTAPLFIVVGSVFLSSGCCSLSWRKDADEVVAARELISRGIESQQDGRDEEASRLFAQAMETCPDDERCRRHYAEVLWRQGQPRQAITHMQEAVRLSGGDPLLIVRLGEMHLAVGDEAEARRQAEVAIARRENLASAWALRGETLRRRGELSEALACYHRALRYEPLYPPVQIALAAIHREQGRPERSLAVLDAAVDQFSPAPAPPELLAHHGLALKEMGRYEEAIESLTAAAESGADPEVLFQLAETRWLSGDIAGASLALHRVLEGNPYHAAARHLEIALREAHPVAATITR